MESKRLGPAIRFIADIASEHFRFNHMMIIYKEIRCKKINLLITQQKNYLEELYVNKYLKNNKINAIYLPLSKKICILTMFINK